MVIYPDTWLVALFAIPIATIGNGFLVQWFKMHPNDPAMAYLDVDFESIVQRDDKDEKVGVYR